MSRVRSDSVTHAVKSAQAASLGPIQPPAHLHLRDGDWPYWNAIIQARAADSWNDADLAFAVNLARCQHDIMRVQDELEEEGDILTNAKGTKVVNPKHALVETLSRRAASLSAKIHVHTAATVGRTADAGKKLAEEKSARAAIDDEDELIPRLRAV